MNNAYSNFSQYYDEMVGENTMNINFLFHLIQTYHPKAKSVLELGCGTGNVLAMLENKYETYGIDISKEMLTIAASKLTKTTLLEENITDYQLPKKVDVILCVFDTINHLLRPDEWDKLFNATSKNLKPSGIFIFDMNTIEMLDAKSKKKILRKKISDINVQLTLSKDHSTYNWYIDTFREEAGEIVKDRIDKIPETSFSLEKVRIMISRHFILKDIKNEKGETWQTPSERPYFICVKKLPSAS